MKTSIEGDLTRTLQLAFAPAVCIDTPLPRLRRQAKRYSDVHQPCPSPRLRRRCLLPYIKTPPSRSYTLHPRYSSFQSHVYRGSRPLSCQAWPRHCTTPFFFPFPSIMPLAERDPNAHRQRPLPGKRVHVAASVIDENAVPSPAKLRAQETPTRQQRFFAPTKASAAKNTPSSATDQPRAQTYSGRITPRSQTQSSKIPRRNAATPTPKPAYDPPISKWNLSVAGNLTAQSKKTADSLPSSPDSPTSRRIAFDRSLVRRDS